MIAQARYNNLVRQSLTFRGWEKYGLTYEMFWNNLNAEWGICHNDAQRLICIEGGEKQLAVYMAEQGATQ